MTTMKKASIREKRIAIALYAMPLIAWIVSSAVFFLPKEVSNQMAACLISLGVPLSGAYKNLLSVSHADWKIRLVSIYAVFICAPMIVASGALFVLKLWSGYRMKYLDKTKKEALKRILVELIFLVTISYTAIFLAGKDLVITRSLTDRFGSLMAMILIGEFWAIGSMVGLLIEDVKLIYHTKGK